MVFGLILSIGTIASGFSQENDYPSVQIEGCGILDAMEFVDTSNKDLMRWTFPDGTQTYGAMVKHCFDKNGSNTVVLEWMDFTNPSIALGSQKIEFVIEQSAELQYDLKVEQGSRKVKATPKLNLKDEPTEIRYFWDTGDGTYLAQEALEHSYDIAGEFKLRLMAEITFDDEVVRLTSEREIKMP